MKVSTGLNAAIISGGSWLTALDDGVLRIYSGEAPASADAAIGSAVLLCEVSLGGTGAGLPLEVDGTTIRKVPTDAWGGTNVATGQASFFRHVQGADTGSASTTAIRIQGTVGLTWDSNMTLVETALTIGEPTPINSFYLDFPTQA